MAKTVTVGLPFGNTSIPTVDVVTPFRIGAASASEAWRRDEQWGTTTIVSLQPATTYGFAVKALNQFGIETSFGPAAFVFTLGGVLGDCDGNGVLEVAADLPCFVDALLGIDTMPPGGILRSDLNGDGVANGLDAALFVGCVVIGCP